MDNVRILNGYSKTEQKELEEAKDNGFNNAMYLINRIVDYADDCTSLTKKYINGSPDENNQLAKDILDFYTDKATFIVPKKYYVQLIKNSDFGYLNRDLLSGFCMTSGCQPDESFQTEFTEQEIKAIDPRYEAFAIKVEDK